MLDDMKRIGHKGAHTIEAGNTIASFEVARDLGVDMIEFDVLRHPYNMRGGPQHGQLVIAHDPHDAGEREDTTLLTLEAALDHLAAPGFTHIGLDVDMKHRGYELELIDALRERDLIHRTTITTMHVESLALIREHVPRADGPRLGITIPKVSRDYLAMPSFVRPLLWAGIAEHRLRQPARVAGMLERGEIEAVMAFHAVVTPRLVKAVHDAGGELYSWTVDDAHTIIKLADMGVDGIVSNDPRLFDDALEVIAATA
jgi:glycerophosphoryl diester phosphodiesterase